VGPPSTAESCLMLCGWKLPFFNFSFRGFSKTKSSHDSPVTIFDHVKHNVPQNNISWVGRVHFPEVVLHLLQYLRALEQINMPSSKKNIHNLGWESKKRMGLQVRFFRVGQSKCDINQFNVSRVGKVQPSG